jgi:hypothetical protein
MAQSTHNDLVPQSHTVLLFYSFFLGGGFVGGVLICLASLKVWKSASCCS